MSPDEQIQAARRAALADPLREHAVQHARDALIQTWLWRGFGFHLPSGGGEAPLIVDPSFEIEWTRPACGPGPCHRCRARSRYYRAQARREM